MLSNAPTFDGGLRTTGNASISVVNGGYFHWNRSGSDGATWILNQGGSGSSPGIRFGRSTTANVVTETMRITDAGVVAIPGLTASQSVQTDASSNLITIANTGTGNL